MNQKKYIMAAVLVLVVGGLIYLGFKKFPQGKDVVNSETIVDYDEPIDTLTKAESDGKMLYISKCISCHGSFMRYDGPNQAMAGFENRWPDKKELFAFIRNPEEVMKRNTYARELKNRYNSMMSGSPNLTDGEIQSILDYIRRELNQ